MATIRKQLQTMPLQGKHSAADVEAMVDKARAKLEAAAASTDPAVKLGALDEARSVVRELRAERARDTADLRTANELQRGALFRKGDLYAKYVAPLEAQTTQLLQAREELNDLGFSVTQSAHDLASARSPMLQAAVDYQRFQGSAEGWDAKVVAPLEQRLYLSSRAGSSEEGPRLRRQLATHFPWPVNAQTPGGARVGELMQQIVALGEHFDALQNARELPRMQPAQPSRLLDYATSRSRTLESQGSTDLAQLDALADLKRQANATEADVRAFNASTASTLARAREAYQSGGEEKLLQEGFTSGAGDLEQRRVADQAQMTQLKTELVALLRSLGPSALGTPDGELGALVAQPPAELQAQLAELNELARADWLNFAAEDPRFVE